MPDFDLLNFTLDLNHHVPDFDLLDFISCQHGSLWSLDWAHFFDILLWSIFAGRPPGAQILGFTSFPHAQIEGVSRL